MANEAKETHRRLQLRRVSVAYVLESSKKIYGDAVGIKMEVDI